MRVIMDMSGKVTLPNPKLIQRDVMLTPFHLVSSGFHANSVILCSNKKCGSQNAITYKQHWCFLLTCSFYLVLTRLWLLNLGNLSSFSLTDVFACVDWMAYINIWWEYNVNSTFEIYIYIFIYTYVYKNYIYIDISLSIYIYTHTHTYTHTYTYIFILFFWYYFFGQL